MTDWAAQILRNHDLTRMGHLQRVEDANLGLGWLYYSLARIVRPRIVVVIGSFRGFAPLMFGKALADNLEGGKVVFIDPSLVDDFWKDAPTVARYFADLGAPNVEHHLCTTQEFMHSKAYQTLEPVGLLFVDGYHSLEQVRFDHEAFQPRMASDGLVLFHDSKRVRTAKIYGPDRWYEHQVKLYMDALKLDSAWQVFDLPFGEGVTLVRKAADENS